MDVLSREQSSMFSNALRQVAAKRNFYLCTQLDNLTNFGSIVKKLDLNSSDFKSNEFFFELDSLTQDPC